ncbi:cell surface protein SprA [Marinoscillum sp.]|uniref:T9SS outer membrane translocon Sov/SprA n=1 Tax=Marinoscillum sp. TaxID=2024838 RepID=UPI003BAD648F
MERKSYIQLLVSVVFLCFGLSELEAKKRLFAPTLLFQQENAKQDTVKRDTIPPYEPSKIPTYQPAYRFGDPFSNRISPSPLQLADPSSIDLQVDYDSSINYSVYERIGDVNFRPVTTMSFEEYDRYNDQQIQKEYFKQKSAGLDGESAVSGRSLIPRLYISPMFDRLFGGSYVDIQPNGFVNLDFGGRFQRVDNPSIPRRQQRNGGFNFDQQISLNLVGKIGEKLQVTANFDNNNTFDFQNNLKVEYTGYEEDIVKKIEIGNVSMPVTNSLMTGAQSLFGVKTQLQFGKLFVTGVVSRQQGKSDVVTVESGFQGKEFQVRASDYDENKHFFLGQFFRDNYEYWHRNLPQIVSGVNVTRIEVYVINRNNDTKSTREVLGLMDLGEGNSEHIYRNGANANGYEISGASGQDPGFPTNNRANNLYADLFSTPGFRSSNDVSNILETQFGFASGVDFAKIGTARRLEDDEFVLNSQLGYVSLLRRLQNDEMLAVSYEYTYNGRVYQVGELTEDYSGLSDDQVIVLKMLRPNRINVEVPTWDLMMKNIYSLNANQVDREGFQLRIHYRDDATGIDNPSLHEGRLTKDKPLVELLGLDQLNQNNDRSRDGNFDFIEGVTMDTRNGNVIFPVLEPFGATLESQFAESENNLKQKYVYNELYESTKIDAEQLASKNKFFIQGKLNAGSSNQISLPGINIAENSVVVTAGNTPLTEGLDYRVDYNLGTVTILNEGILNSGKTINIAYEKADLFNFQSRWLYGARMDYRFSENFNIGATLLHLNERPGGISRYTIGDEPTRNTKYGFDINYQDEVPFLTKAMDFLPLISTKAPSSISFNAEFAQIVPGTSNLVDGKGTSYIDDFESAVTPINLSGAIGWKLGTTPQTSNNRFNSATNANVLGFNYKKAKIAWYSVDPSVFYQAGPRRPANINEDDLDNHYVRPVLPQEIFRQRDRNVFLVPETIFDIAYYPHERGPYNYNPNLTQEGLLPNPEQNYGAIYRNITTETNFRQNNVEYLEFWLLDPFIDGENGRVLDGLFNQNNTTGGQLVFNLGDISEDFNNDGRKSFESGYPADGDETKTISNDWGRQPDEPFLTNNFEQTGRGNQDVGFDGLRDEEETTFFNDYINQLNVSPDALNAITVDPSGDNFQYFLGDQFDNNNVKILERYKNFNGLDGNSPVQSGNNVQSYTIIPDNEDSNTDGNFVTSESYNEYKINLRPGQLEIGENFIVDKIRSINDQDYWYLFRIPINTAGTPVNGGMDINTVRSVRMYLTGFRQPVVLRMAKLQLVGSQWRKYSETPLNEPGLNEVPETTYSDFTLSVVNIEENSGGADKIPYTVPPGINRDRDNTTIINRQVNEQSLQICVEDLADKDARAVFKNTTIDLINYGRLQMFFHAEEYRGDMLLDDEMSAFLRLGTQANDQYYEIEVPLKVTPQGTGAVPELVWPKENEIDLSINELLGLKSERNRGGFDETIAYSSPSNDGRYKLTIKGNPDMSSIQTLMIGVRNPGSDDGAPKSVCIWANELRVTDFDKRRGWAANARVSAKLADVATVSASTRYTSIGFGNIQQTIQQRTRHETTQYDVSANVNLDKFLLPEKTGLKVPMFVSMEKSRTIPQYDPLDPDVPLEASLETIDTQEERDEYRRIVEDRSERRSINFTNVRKEKTNPEANDHFFDIENLSVSYAYSDIVTSNVNTETYIQKNVSGGVAYNYAPRPLVIEPFAKSEAFSSPYLKLIKDANLSLSPSNISVRADLARSFRMTRLYDEQLQPQYGNEFYERLFTFNRTYGLRWNIFKSLSLDYSAKANAVIDEIEDTTPIEGDIDSEEERQYIWNEIKSLGRLKNFTQDVSATYKLPFDKFPITDWVSGDIRYAVGYNWTAGSLGQNDDSGDFFGHTLQNRRDRGLTGKIDMVKLYNKVTFLKNINQPTRKRSKDDEEQTGPNLGKTFLRMMMSLRSINVTYNIRETTSLAGFVKQPFLLGMDSSWNAPGWGFILGEQDPEIRYRAAQNGWLTRSQSLTTPFMQTYTNDLSLRANIEPAADIKIQLDAQRTNNASFQEIYRYDTLDGVSGFKSLTPSRKGSYNLSFNTIRTAFDNKGANNSSEAFDTFASNISAIQNRQNSLINASDGFYDTLSQDVLIPAFIAAYSGQSAGDVGLTPFPKIPLPGWRVDYNGLSKIPALAEVFSSITISHGYRSAYNVNDYNFNIEAYANNPNNNFGVTLDNNVLDYPRATVPNDSNRLVPVYVISQVTIAEQFAPLLGINIRTKNNLSTRLEYKKDRSLSLNMSNAQVTETTSNDFTMDLGLTKDEFKLPFKVKGRTITLDNAITMRVSMTLRDSETIQRKIDGESKITNGNTNFQLRPSMTYKLNKSLDLTMYFERSVNEPKISSFKTATTAFGTQLRFSLAQ